MHTISCYRKKTTRAEQDGLPPERTRQLPLRPTPHLPCTRMFSLSSSTSPTVALPSAPSRSIVHKIKGSSKPGQERKPTRHARHPQCERSLGYLPQRARTTKLHSGGPHHARAKAGSPPCACKGSLGYLPQRAHTTKAHPGDPHRSCARDGLAYAYSFGTR